MGPDLMGKLREQAERFGATLETDQVERVELAERAGWQCTKCGWATPSTVRAP